MTETSGKQLPITCDAAHPALTVFPTEYVHDDGAQTYRWECPECGISVSLKQDTRDAIFAQSQAAGVTQLPIGVLATAVTRGAWKP